jgi:hypothetical protein
METFMVSLFSAGCLNLSAISNRVRVYSSSVSLTGMLVYLMTCSLGKVTKVVARPHNN